jgi:hypothetical protein
VLRRVELALAQQAATERGLGDRIDLLPHGMWCALLGTVGVARQVVPCRRRCTRPTAEGEPRDPLRVQLAEPQRGRRVDLTTLRSERRFVERDRLLDMAERRRRFGRERQ